MASIDSLSGQCLCGAVSFTASNVQTGYHACHCNMCRRWTGAVFMGVHADAASFEGEDKLQQYESSEWASRGFCSACGTSLFYYLKPNDHYVFCAGAFDDQSKLQMKGEIFVDSQPPGYQFAGEHLYRMTEQEFMDKYFSDA